MPLNHTFDQGSVVLICKMQESIAINCVRKKSDSLLEINERKVSHVPGSCFLFVYFAVVKRGKRAVT